MESIEMSTFHSQCKTKISENIILSCKPTVAAISNIFEQKLSMCGNQPENEWDRTLHLRTVMNPANFHGLELDESKNQEQILILITMIKYLSGRVYKPDKSLQKLLILLKQMAHF